jgi:hypothetical protein
MKDILGIMLFVGMIFVPTWIYRINYLRMCSLLKIHPDYFVCQDENYVLFCESEIKWYKKNKRKIKKHFKAVRKGTRKKGI